MAIILDDVLFLRREKPEYAAALTALLVMGLSKQQRTVYRWSAGRHIDSRFVEVNLGVSAFRAGFLLKKLYDMGLLEREAVVSNVGKKYKYRRTEA